MRVVAVQVLFPVTAGQVDEVAHPRARQVGEPVTDGHAQRQLGREHPVRGGARAVRVPPVAVGVARPHEEVGADDLEHLAVQVVGVADVARMVDQLRDRRVGLHGVGDAVVGRAFHVVGVARAHPVDGVAVVGDLVRGECVLQDHDAALGELPPLFGVEAVRGDAVGAHALPPVRGAVRQDVGRRSRPPNPGTAAASESGRSPPGSARCRARQGYRARNGPMTEPLTPGHECRRVRWPMFVAW